MRACYSTTVIIEEVPVRNAYAKALASPLFRQRKVAARKGKGAYKRTAKHVQKPVLDV
jgi:stalled ribosome alternative rescue factor ArfA